MTNEIDLRLNKIEEPIRKIHLIAVCGTGMGALACMLKDMGYAVTGSDRKVYPPMSTFLRNHGIRVLSGFHQDHLKDPPDLVVVGNAVSKDNPEVAEMIKRQIPFCSMPQGVNHFAGKNKKTLLITGTHGKTTTSSMTAWLLYQAGLDPSFMIGGILNDFGSNYRIGNGEYMVIEGDEYDTAFFDKGPKLMHYDPSVTVLTGIEFDHADIFRDLDHVMQVFKVFLSRIPSDRMLIAAEDDENISRLINEPSCTVQTYGLHPNAYRRLGRQTVRPPWTVFDVYKAGRYEHTFKIRQPGRHNALNALSVIAIADYLSIPATITKKAFETFSGVKRRQEVRGRVNGITVMDDFAHHPTAVRETIQAVKPFYPDGRIIAVFEPRTNTSMRKVFQPVYPLSFDKADLICICPPPSVDKIPPNERFSSRQLVSDLTQNGKEAYFFPDTRSVIAFLIQTARPGDLVLIMSNGGFDDIHQKLLKRLEQDESLRLK